MRSCWRLTETRSKIDESWDVNGVQNLSGYIYIWLRQGVAKRVYWTGMGWNRVDCFDGCIGSYEGWAELWWTRPDRSRVGGASEFLALGEPANFGKTGRIGTGIQCVD